MIPGALALALALGGAGIARASQEAEDLKRQIESQRAQVSDFERLDERRQVTDEITLYKSWLDEAWGLYSRDEYKKVRTVLDRLLAQAELIRQKTAAAKMSAYAAEREAALRASHDRVERTKKALFDAQSTKKALEMNAK